MKVFYLPAGVLALILACSLWAGRFLEMRTEHWTALLAGAVTMLLFLILLFIFLCWSGYS